MGADCVVHSFRTVNRRSAAFSSPDTAATEPNSSGSVVITGGCETLRCRCSRTRPSWELSLEAYASCTGEFNRLECFRDVVCRSMGLVRGLAGLVELEGCSGPELSEIADIGLGAGRPPG